MMQQAQNRVVGQLKEKLSQAIATGKLKPKKPAVSNAAQNSDPTKPLEQALSIATRIVAVNGVILQHETLGRLDTIRRLVHPFGVPMENERSKKVTQMRRAAETCQNYIVTVSTGIRENDVDVADLPNIANKLTRLIKDVIACVEAYNAKEDPNVPAIDDTLTEAKLRKFGASKARLVSRILKSNRITTYATMPVLAIFEPAVRTLDLHEAGLPVEGYDGLYSIVLEQQVIGITNDPPEGLTHDSLLDQALRSISRSKRMRFSVVSDQPVGMTKYGMKFYWVADPRTLAVLDNVKGNHIQVAKWSFPF